MLILDLLGVSFHAAVVFGLGKDFLFRSTIGHCTHKVPNEYAASCTLVLPTTMLIL